MDNYGNSRLSSASYITVFIEYINTKQQWANAFITMSSANALSLYRCLFGRWEFSARCQYTGSVILFMRCLSRILFVKASNVSGAVALLYVVQKF